MSDFSNILIKYSVVTATPMSLLQGELAYSQVSGNLYIGDNNHVPVLIAGATLVQQLGGIDTAVATLRAEFDIVKGDLDLLIPRVNALELRLDAEDLRLQGEIDGVNARVDALENTTVPGITNRLDSLEATRDVHIATLADHESRIGNVESMLGGGSGTPTFTDLTVTGNLTVNGTTTAINSTVTTLNDPVISLGDGTGTSSDGMDRGVSFKHTVGGQVKTGFFGMDATDGKFKFIPDATEVASNVFEGDLGTIEANIAGGASKLNTARKIDLGGEASGFTMFDGSTDVQINVVVEATPDATNESIVRRDNMGAAKFTAVETSVLSNMYGGINGKSQHGAASALTGFVINGGTF
jgi:hypothetical protein